MRLFNREFSNQQVAIGVVIPLVLLGGVFAWQYLKEKASITNWDGIYEYSEFAPPNQAWVYTLKIYKEDNIRKANLDIDGFQTLTHLQAVAEEHDGNLDIIFDSYRPENIGELYQKGDLLFSLKNISDDEYQILWNKIKSNLLESADARFKKVSKEETANWQTYRNEEYGFEIKYPQGFSIDPSSGRQTISPSSESVPNLVMYFAANEWLGQQLNYPTIGITVSRTNLTAKQWVEENFLVGPEPGQYDPYHGRSKEITETTIGNYPVLQFDYFFASGHSRYMVFRGKDTVISLSNNVTGFGDNEEIYNQMLSTFKF